MVMKGQKINDRYQIIKSIGEGGMANVYLAYDTILDRDVAVKVLRGDLANDEKFVRRFQREALAASSLSHPNIVEVYDVGEDNGEYYIVMEYIEGKHLKSLIKKRGKLTVSEAVDIVLQITAGLSVAHDSYIIHRDIKPQNIMILENGLIKITDFGIAMALNSTQLTQTNSVMGSVHYLPPEQASGKGSTIKSDIYSMGILFYELLTGVLPFKGDNAVEIALKQMKEAIPSVRKQNPNIPQSVENIILRATAKNPKNRYNDSREMYNELKHCLDEDKQDVDRIVFKYPEHESEDTKKIPVIKNEEKKKNDVESTGDIVKQIPKEKPSKSKMVIWILSGVLFLIIAILAIAFFLTAGKKVPNVTVPDVSGMTVVDAEQVLTDAGFEVKTETIKMPDKEYEKGKVIKTDPEKGRSIKKGKTITLYESTGDEAYVIEDYTGKNYIEIETLLKTVHKLNVSIEKKSVDKTDDMDNQTIVDQSLKAGTEVKEGDKIILYIPDAYEEYPDFVNEDWSLSDIEAFCEKYSIKLNVVYQETEDYEDGKIMRQSRAAKDRIVEGASLKITVAKAIKKQQEPTTDDNTDQNEQP